MDLVDRLMVRAKTTLITPPCKCANTIHAATHRGASAGEGGRLGQPLPLAGACRSR
jgi:hypothetical protein